MKFRLPIFRREATAAPADNTQSDQNEGASLPSNIVSVQTMLIEIFTDPNDVVIDPTAGSGSSLLAAANLNRRAYGFEIKKDFFRLAQEKIMPLTKVRQTNIFDDI